MNANDLGANAFFTTDGTDVWKVRSFCMQPTCILENLETGKSEDFGMGGLIAQSFHKIEMPKEAKK